VLCTEAKERHPARWARHTRNWNPIGPVTLNPERDSVIAERVAKKLIQSLAA
jgi:putative transposase